MLVRSMGKIRLYFECIIVLFWRYIGINVVEGIKDGETRSVYSVTCQHLGLTSAVDILLYVVSALLSQLKITIVPVQYVKNRLCVPDRYI
jgi:hypothetical protein